MAEDGAGPWERPQGLWALGDTWGCVPGKGRRVPILSPVPDSFRNVIFDITPGDEAGKFEVNAKFLGVDMEQLQLHYQVRGLRGPGTPARLLVRCLMTVGRPQMTPALPPTRSVASVPERRVRVRQPQPLWLLPCRRPWCHALSGISV